VTCPFTHDAAAYVLGALSPAERLDFEKHLTRCDGCTRGVGELAGLPGLLGRVDASVLEHAPVDEPVPDTLLPALAREVRRRARRRTFVAAGSLAAVLAIAVPWGLSQLGDDGGQASTVPGSGSSPSGATAREMDPVGDVPVHAKLTMEAVAWGSRLELMCTYDPESPEYQPPVVRYALFVRTRDGRAEGVGSWRSESGRTTRLTAATSEALADIASVEVRTLDGRVVLRLAG